MFSFFSQSNSYPVVAVEKHILAYWTLAPSTGDLPYACNARHQDISPRYGQDPDLFVSIPTDAAGRKQTLRSLNIHRIVQHQPGEVAQFVYGSCCTLHECRYPYLQVAMVCMV